MPRRISTPFLPSHTASKAEDLRWGLVAPLGTSVEFDPTQLANAQPVAAYLVEENDLHVTVYYEPRAGKRRFYLSNRTTPCGWWSPSSRSPGVSTSTG